MVWDALLNGEPIRAAAVDRRTNSTLGVHPEFMCIGCNHKLIHCLPTSSEVSPIAPYFAHRAHKDCDICKSCPYYVGNLQVATTYDRNDLINNEFVKGWQQNYPHYLDAEQGVLYNLGSPLGAITIYDDISDKHSKNISSSKEPLKIVMLNGSRLDLDYVCLDNTGSLWARPNCKSFIDDMLKRKAIVLLDDDNDHIIRLTSLDVINHENYDYEFNRDKPLSQFYKCDIVHIDKIIKEYFPKGYKMVRTNKFNFKVVKIAKSNFEIKRREREEAELRRIQKEEEKRLEEERKFKQLAEERKKNYIPRKLKNKDEVLELYKNYIDSRHLISGTTQFTRQTAEDGTEFIDITSDTIQDQNIKCVYDTHLLIREIRAVIYGWMPMTKINDLLLPYSA